MTQPTDPPPLSTLPVTAANYIPTADDRTMGMSIHLGLIFAAVLSLIIWLIKREKSPFIEHHGKQALAFFVTSAIAGVALWLSCVGVVLLPVLLVGCIVFPILAGLAANRGEWYVYPVIGRMFQ